MTRKPVRTRKPAPGAAASAVVPAEVGFGEIVRLIDAPRQRAFQAVNTTLIELYWQVGEHVSHKIAAAE